jgi:hypothetical protein
VRPVCASPRQGSAEREPLDASDDGEARSEGDGLSRFDRQVLGGRRSRWKLVERPFAHPPRSYVAWGERGRRRGEQAEQGDRLGMATAAVAMAAEGTSTSDQSLQQVGSSSRGRESCWVVNERSNETRR